MCERCVRCVRGVCEVCERCVCEVDNVDMVKSCHGTRDILSILGQLNRKVCLYIVAEL